MALPVNPLSQVVSSVSERFAADFEGDPDPFGVLASGADFDKIQLDETVDRLSGGVADQINSAANSAAGAASNALGDLRNSVSTVAGSIGGDIQGTLQNITGGGLAGGIQGAAGAVSKTAGMLNNILSLSRGSSLPKGGELFSQSGSSIKVEPNAKNDWRVRINCDWSIFPISGLFRLLADTGGVVWPYTPDVSFTTQADYSTETPVHSNYPQYSYKNSQVQEIEIRGQFSAETKFDAAYWLAATTFFRTATKMFYGQSENAGNPPLVCNLSGYGQGIFPNVPIIVKRFHVNLNKDVDYINCNMFGTNTWVPILSEIDVTVAPIYSRTRMRQFSLQEYATGRTLTSDGIGWL